MRQTGNGHTIDFIYDENNQPRAMIYDGTTYLYELNLQGDVIGIVNKSGTSMAKYAYDAWGKIISSSGSLANVNPLRYRGYYYDTDTELYYLGSRYYDPAVKRFINADNANLITANPYVFTDKNLFAYCDNNPVMREDDDGEFWNIIAGATFGAAISAATQIAANAISGEKLSSGVLMAAVSGGISGALASSGVGLIGQIVGNAAIGGISEVSNQISYYKANKNSYGVKDAVMGTLSVVAATGAGALSGYIGGAGVRANGGSVQRAAAKVANTSQRIQSGIYHSQQTISKLSRYALNGYKRALSKSVQSTAKRFLTGNVVSQVVTRTSYRVARW